MYNKRNRKPIISAVAAAVVLILIIIATNVLPAHRAAKKERETEESSEEITEEMTEAPAHNILLYKPGAGTVEFDSSWLISDDEQEALLCVEENTLVTIMITPLEGKTLDTVDVLDYEMKSVDYLLHAAYGSDLDTGKEMRLSFVMPDRDVFISFTFADVVTGQSDPGDEDDTEEEVQTEEGPPYGLTLHNLNADIITSFNGMFDEKKFLQALGDALHIDSARSEYRTVTDVYFGRQEMSDADKISYHVYFNGDELWEVLATYYMAEDSYVFTEAAAPQTEAETSTYYDDDSAVTSGGSYETSAGSPSGVSGSMAGGTGSAGTTTTSLDILSVSTVFLAYVGDEDAFYQAVFDYVLQNGCTGSIVGTMSGYEIDPEKKKATIHIMLSTGGTVTATYNKAKNSYSFSGL